MVMCCQMFVFWLALVPLRLACPRLVFRNQTIPILMVVFYFLTPLCLAFGHFGLYYDLGGLPGWGKIEGDRYFLGKAWGEGYTEVSREVYSFFVWFEIVGYGSLAAMMGSAAVGCWLNARHARKTAVERLRVLCGRTDGKSLYGLIELIGDSEALGQMSPQDRSVLRNKILRGTQNVDVALKPPLTLDAPPDVLAREKELWTRFVQEHEAEIIKGRQ